MKQILRDNALEAWAMAIKHCNAIMDGKITLGYRKQFVTSLHNAVELLIKQHMLMGYHMVFLVVANSILVRSLKNYGRT